jgi:hypothetical protein
VVLEGGYTFMPTKPMSFAMSPHARESGMNKGLFSLGRGADAYHPPARCDARPHNDHFLTNLLRVREAHAEAFR